ncbi:hypothetical protein [Bacillus wiedmannii]|uniref:Uncharacterized protein n=1 Tax=Bacillus wiedmannii TaxID=1890302 RepID=A0A2C4PSX9_9BACI|nr:hypothetical protein [Bacillus wiedmannii]KPU59565.1 hypothetical protein AN402_5494 [Bacillus wiedmannii]PHD55361.1 hypothetical protein COF57_30240 [Bacillus wiedmannii]PRT26583.1 hypothetical protein C6358_29645 [Bacillus wiedmannii]PRT37959.1 hypothetical protein C6359_29675 [Bacillus wiedmannii]
MREKEMIMFLPDGRYEYLRINVYTEDGKTKLDYKNAYKRILTVKEQQRYLLHNELPKPITIA